MTKKQITVLQRIIRRETAVWNLQSNRPQPGLHASGDKFVVTDGEICVLLSCPVERVPQGGRMDSLAGVVERELHLGMHLRLPDAAISPRLWWSLLHIQGDGKAPTVELSVSDEAGQTASARFKAQLLLDAVEAIGADPQMFLGFGNFTSQPTLLVRQRDWAIKGGTGPVVLILPVKEGME